MSFRERLQRATERGKQARAAQLNEAAAKALSEEECRRLHSQYRLALTEHIEKCLREMADNFPGFRMETVVDESGWGAAVSRDDFRMEGGRARHVLQPPAARGQPVQHVPRARHRREGHGAEQGSAEPQSLQRLADVDLQSFRELMEQWVLDYAELYSAAV